MRELLVKNDEFKDSPLGKIPKDWDVKTLGELGYFQNGLNKGKKDFGFGTKFVNISDVYTQRLDVNNLGRMNASQSEISSYQLEIGDILIDRSSVKLDGVGYPTIFEGADETVVFCGFIIRFRLSNSVIKARFLCELMRDDSFRNRVFKIATKSANVNVNQEQLAKLFIAIPSLQEQQGIAEILDTADRAIAQTSALITKLKQTKAGLLHDLLTRGLDENGQLRNPQMHPEQFKESAIGLIPKDWEVKLLGQVITSIDAGKSPNCPDEPANTNEWGVLKVSAVHPQGFRGNENKVIINPAYVNPHYEVKNNDLLITRSNTYELVGLSCLVESPPPHLLLCDKTLRLNVDNRIALVNFIAYILQMPYMRLQIENNATGSSAGMKNISQEIIKNFIIVLPKYKDEQEKIVGILDSYNTRIRKEEAYLNKLKLQKQGLMQDLLTGKVRVKAIT